MSALICACTCVYWHVERCRSACVFVCVYTYYIIIIILNLFRVGTGTAKWVIVGNLFDFLFYLTLKALYKRILMYILKSLYWVAATKVMSFNSGRGSNRQPWIIMVMEIYYWWNESAVPQLLFNVERFYWCLHFSLREWICRGFIGVQCVSTIENRV